MGLLLPLMSASTACGTDGAGDDVARQLMRADRLFATTVAEEGIAGWLAFMADDAVRLPGLGEAGVRGKDRIAELDGGMFADPTRRLVWEPTDAGGFADGRHGYTTGRYRVLVEEGGEQKELGAGAYITWWRLQDGAWKVILDTGAAD